MTTINEMAASAESRFYDYVCRTGPLGRYLQLELDSFFPLAAETKGRKFARKFTRLAKEMDNEGDDEARDHYLSYVEALRDKSVSDFPRLLKMVDWVIGSLPDDGHLPHASEIADVLCIDYTDDDDDDDVWEIVRLLMMPAFEQDFIAGFLSGVDDFIDENDEEDEEDDE